MGIIGFADVNLEEVSAHDEQVGRDFDRRRQEIEDVAQVGRAARA
jgi:hypothetical protein